MSAPSLHRESTDSLIYIHIYTIIQHVPFKGLDSKCCILHGISVETERCDRMSSHANVCISYYIPSSDIWRVYTSHITKRGCYE